MTLSPQRVSRLRALAVLALALVSPLAIAQPAHDAFRFARSLTPSAAGPARVNVDVPLLSGAEPNGALRDLRITGEDGHDVPYILVAPRPAREEIWLHGTVSLIPATDNESGLELDLGRLAHVDRLRFGGLPRPLLKQARIEGAGDRTHYTVLAKQAIVFDLPDEQLVSLDVPLPDAEVRYVRVTWDNHATSALPLPRQLEVREVTPTTPPEPLVADVPFERRPSRAGESRFRVHLPGPALPVVAVELVCGGGHLLRPARVTQPQLRGDEVVPIELGRATLRRSTHDGLSASSLRVPVASPKGKELEVVVDDGDNAPLDLQGVSVVLAPQPWIYLEATGTTPLVAHYGNARLAAPHYDLEAARTGLATLHPAVATWGSPRPDTAVPSPEPPPATLAGAAIDAEGFGQSRVILPGDHPAAGLAAVALDAAALAHSASLTDLRVRDATGHQVPYLLERQEEPTLVDLELEPVAKDDPHRMNVPAMASLYRVLVPFAELPPGRLVLSTSARVFQRHVTLLAPRPAGASPRDPEVSTLETREWTHADPETPTPALAMPYTARAATAIYVRVDEGDNAPLALTGVRLELPGVRLRFFRAADSSLTLLYGNPALTAPKYDLALLAPTLAGAVAAELSLGAEMAAPVPTTEAAKGMPIFWAALVGAVVVLVALMGVLLRRTGAPAGE